MHCMRIPSFVEGPSVIIGGPADSRSAREFRELRTDLESVGGRARSPTTRSREAEKTEAS